MAQHFEARLLDPLQYHSFIDAGASGGTVTAPFLGDLALAFAINASVLGIPLEERRFVSGKKYKGPDYQEDIGRIGLVLTVGISKVEVRYLNPEYQGSSYMGEGFEQRNISSGAKRNEEKLYRINSSVMNSSWRPWRQAQLIAPGNVFQFSILKGAQLPKHFALRMGTGRASLIEVTETGAPTKVTLNPWSAEAVHGVNIQSLPCSRREYPLAKYPLMHGVPLHDALEALG
jgi:hypothetical protein